MKSIRVDIFYRNGDSVKKSVLINSSGEKGAKAFVKAHGVDMRDIIKIGIGNDRQYWYNDYI